MLFSVLFFCVCLPLFCDLYPILPVYLDCPFGVSNVYLESMLLANVI